MYFLTTILILFTYLSKYNISFYVFNANFFENIEVLEFELLKIQKVYGASVPICTKSLVESNDTAFMNFSKF
jgi:hypothetical protein